MRSKPQMQPDPANAPPDETAEDYFAWRDAKVTKALAALKEQPESRVRQAEVWKKFGLEP